MLTQKQKTEWAAALRSGNFQQHGGRLYDGCCNQYCCLGVLAKINGLPTDGYLLNSREHASISLAFSSADYTVSGEVNLISETGAPLGKFLTLADANDARIPFPDLADWIDANLATLD